ncbi:hypothetical protein KAU33_14245 [Candidatus Dependentiae bacterium]|nr:hypothetical protein [Candidatus Dependentiae bacterium]
MPSKMQHELNKIKGVVSETGQISKDSIALLRKALNKTEIAIKALESNTIDQSSKINNALSKANQALSISASNERSNFSVENLEVRGYLYPDDLYGFTIRDINNNIQASFGKLSEPNAMDVISERTGNSGVTIDGLHIKDDHIESVMNILKVKVNYTDDGDAILLGYIPPHSYIYNIKIFVHTAFSDTGTDTISVGIPALHTHYVDTEDVSTFGLKEPPRLNTWAIVGAMGHNIYAYYEGQNDNAGAGAALVFIEYILHSSW